MPTDEQLIDSWRTQFKLGLSNEQYYCQDGNPEYHPPSQKNTEFRGEKLGTISFNPETEEMEIKIDKNLEEKL